MLYSNCMHVYTKMCTSTSHAGGHLPATDACFLPAHIAVCEPVSTDQKLNTV